MAGMADPKETKVEAKKADVAPPAEAKADAKPEAKPDSKPGKLPPLAARIVKLGALASWIGAADEELIAARDVPLDVANKSGIESCGRLGAKGIAFLVKATGHERSRIRINAIAGLGRWGKADPEPALRCLEMIEQTDPVPDTRTAAKQAMLAIVAREKTVGVDALPKNIPAFEERKLRASGARAARPRTWARTRARA